MSLLGVSYDYQRPEKTYTLEQFIACQSDESFCYANLSFVDQIDNIKYPTYNVASDYIDEIVNDFCVDVELNDDQASHYKYRPKLLAYDVYGSQEIYFLILLMNDICSVKEFTKKRLKLPTKSNMAELCKSLINANKSDINIYNIGNIITSAEIEEGNKK